jgi:Ca2+-binding RTX toxin-like protein
MSFIRRRPGRDGLENDLRRYRPEPREDFVRELSARVAADRPARSGARARVGLAGVLTAGLLVAASVFGGIGYAASSVSHAAHAVAAVFTFSPHKVGTVSAAADQYGKVTLCHNGHEITVSPDAVPAHLAQGDTPGPCPVFAPPIHGTAANDTLDLSRSRANSVIVDTQGSNTIKTGNGNNRVTTGKGNDVITTGRGVNLVKTGAGNDTINSHGRDSIFAGTGNDTIDVRNGKSNFVNCGAGRDIVIADPANLDFVSNNCEIVRRAKFQP